MIKKIIIFVICAVALAGTNYISVFASEELPVSVSGNDVVPDVSSESSKVGEFGASDSTFQDFLDFLDSLSNLGMNLSTDDPVEEESQVFDELEDDSEILSDSYSVMPLADYNTYPSGTIAEPFVTYFRGYLPKLHWNQHYLLFRSNEGVSVGSNYVYGYVYYFVVGENLSVSGTSFSGSNVTVYRMYYYNSSYNSFGVTTQSTFSLTQTGGSFVFTDLSSNYPSLETLSDRTSRQILYALVIGFLITFVSKLYTFVHRGRNRA